MSAGSQLSKFPRKCWNKTRGMAPSPSSRWACAMPFAPATRPLATVQRSMLVIIFHLLADPTNTFCDLGDDYYEKQTT